MPEGDVLLRVSRRLHEALAGDELVRSELRWGDLGGIDFTGWEVLESVSYGKNTLIRLDSGHTLHTHLKMDGAWWIEPTAAPPRPYPDPNVRVVLASVQWTCLSRHTGQVHVLRTRDEPRLLAALGPDLLAGSRGAADPHAPDFAAIAASAQRYAHAPGEEVTRTIGALLLNQRIAAGIGTIYLAESLWITRVHPLTPAGELTVEVLERIYRTAAALMDRSASAPHLTATGDLRPGWRTHVHGRDRRPCRRCGEQIATVSVGRPPYARPGYFCPRCQPSPSSI